MAPTSPNPDGHTPKQQNSRIVSGSAPSLTPLGVDDPIHERVSGWLASYVTQPHPELGRRGPVCPYVAQAIASDHISLTACRLGRDQNLERLTVAIDHGIDLFGELARCHERVYLFSMIMVFTDLKREHWRWIDEGHHLSKPEAVRSGLMLGQFHPQCKAPAAHNPSFWVNRAPVPLIAIRHMAPHDFLFLDDPVWLDQYIATMGRRGIAGERLLASSHGRGRTPRSACHFADDTRLADTYRLNATQTATVAPYVRYACLDQLHKLQFPKTDSPLELSFVLITQVKELLFRMLYVELDAARAHARAADLLEACRALTRAHRVQQVLLVAWNTITGMSPSDFVRFRPLLGEASGQQSFMYRALEFIMGNKDMKGLNQLREFGPLPPIIQHEAAAPSLYDEVITCLKHRVSRETPEPEILPPPAVGDDIEATWLRIYREPASYPVEHQLAEALIELSFQFSQWRATHLLVVERMIGTKPGTGGTEGVEWLRRINQHRFFPELWNVRSRL